MTKVYCAALECEYRKEDGRCAAGEIHLSDHSVMTLYDGRQHFHRCKMWQKSQRAIELEMQFAPLIAFLNRYPGAVQGNNGHDNRHENQDAEYGL